MDCDRPLGDIYGETMELVKVSLCLSHDRLSLTINSIFSPGGVTRERPLNLSMTAKDPRLDESILLEHGEIEGMCFA